MSNDESKLKEIFRNIIRKQYPEVWNFLHKYLDQWMRREDWLEHEIILKVLCDKLDYLHKQIMVANSILVNVNEFKDRVDRLYNQSYDQWEDWYAELRAIDYLNKKYGFNNFTFIRAGNTFTPDFEALRNGTKAFVEVKHKHYSEDDKIFAEFERKLCAESVRDEILRKSFGSNFQKNPNEFKKLLESKNKWGIFVKELKEKIKAHERRYTYSNEIVMNWFKNSNSLSEGFCLQDQLVETLLPRPRSQNIGERRNESNRKIESFCTLLKKNIKKALDQISSYSNNSIHEKLVIYFVKLNTQEARSLDRINNSIIQLKNEIEVSNPNTILDIVM